MADGMNKISGARRKVRGLALFLLACAPPLVAADPSDPTRPPPGFSEQGRVGAAPQEPPLLLSSLFLMGNKSYAVVDGQVVRVGDKLEAGRVGKIDEAGVWLQTATGPRQLKLLPDVSKTPAGKARKKVEKR
jgi:hypothetical protein